MTDDNKSMGVTASSPKPPTAEPSLKDRLDYFSSGDDSRYDLMILIMDAALEKLAEKAGDHRLDDCALERFALALFARVEVGKEVVKQLERELEQAGNDIKNLQSDKDGLTRTQLHQSSVETELRSLLEDAEQKLRVKTQELDAANKRADWNKSRLDVVQAELDHLKKVPEPPTKKHRRPASKRKGG